MKITVDTNVLLRFLVRDDPDQSEVARQELERADRLVFPIGTLLEAAWVLHRRYRLDKGEISARLRGLIAVDKADLDRPAVEAGLAMMALGGDFADGVIAYQGRVQRADVFVSFDRKAVRLLVESGQPARLAGTTWP